MTSLLRILHKHKHVPAQVQDSCASNASCNTRGASSDVAVKKQIQVQSSGASCASCSSADVPLLEVDNVNVTLFSDKQQLPALQQVHLRMRAGETLAVVGESGCGKSMSALAIMGLLPTPPAKLTCGSIRFQGEDITHKTEKERQAYRGSRIGMIFQEPMTSLNPVMSAGNQICEAILAHNPRMNKHAARLRALDMLSQVGIPAPEKVYASYPHELSGGMRQRIMIAMALACEPELLICDEPTTALDVTIQAQILQLLNRLKTTRGTAIMLITHDMGVVSEMADWVLVMYAGHTVEYTRAADLFAKPLHPYTQGLIDSIPTFESTQEELYAIPGSVPMLHAMPEGCPFHPRCPFAREICKTKKPQMQQVGQQAHHEVRCWKYSDVWEGDSHEN